VVDFENEKMYVDNLNLKSIYNNLNKKLEKHKESF
jgi:hypothetical protein